MKATTKELAGLRRRIAAARLRKRLCNAEIGRLAHVDPSQVSRVVRGDFKTVSSNVVQICKVLGLEIDTVATPADERDVAWSRLETSVRRLWDEHPQRADSIATLLESIAELQST